MPTGEFARALGLCYFSLLLRARSLCTVPLALLLVSCGNKGGSPTGSTPLPGPSSNPGGGGSQSSGNNTVNLVVFYDENSNGVLDPNERGRVPEVDVQLGGQSGRSEKATGRVTISGVGTGTQALAVDPDSLPPYYAAPASAAVRVPEDTSGVVNVPLRLSIGSNRPGTYMGFGDSITRGDGSGDGAGYRDRLTGKLVRHFGEAVVLDQGIGGTQTDYGAQRIVRDLASFRPAYTLILYGTNDWNIASCRSHFPCHVVDNLRLMVRRTKNAHSLPVVGTIIPANPDRNIPERNTWVARMNELIRPMAAEEGAVVADLEERMLGAGGRLSDLFEDHVHPNDRGYEVISAAWFEAIAHGSVAPAPQGRHGFLFRP
jgi:lysophospholipase L1-like esterase